MTLTLSIDIQRHVAVPSELHALVAGDTYNPLVLDLSQLTQQELDAVDTATLSIVVYRSRTDLVPVASANLFSVPQNQKKLRTTALLMNQQAVADWLTASGAGVHDGYVVISDADVTYVACDIPVILRPFSVGSAETGFYTAAQVDALLAGKQKVLEGVGAVSVASDGKVSVAPATAAQAGVVKPGTGMSVAGDGTLNVNFPAPDEGLDPDSPNAVQNSAVAEAIEGLSSRADAILKEEGGVESGRLKELEDAMQHKADDENLAAVARSGSFYDLTDAPPIPSASPGQWYAGEGVTGSSSEPTTFTGSGVAYASVGDMYLNTATGMTYRCAVAGNAATAKWSAAGSIKGPKGDTGEAGSTTVSRSYESVAAMTAGWSSDSVPAGGLVIISAGADAGKLYRKGSAAYEYLATLKGAKGDKGDKGDTGSRWHVSTVFTGTGASAAFASLGVDPVEGDLGLNPTTFDIYKCTLGGTAATALWSYVGCIKGTAGIGTKGDAGDPGKSMLAGLEVAAAGSVTGVNAKEGDLYWNTSSRVLFRCSTASGSSTTWVQLADLSSVVGPASVTAGYIPAWAALNVLGQGYAVQDELPEDAAAGADAIPTSYAVRLAIGEIADGVVMAPNAHVAGYVPKWNNDNSLASGYEVRTSVRQAGLATDNALVTEAAVRAALGGTFIQVPETHTENYIPQWGSGASLKNGLLFRTEVRSAGTADNLSLVSEAAVRAACTAIETLLANKKLDDLAAPVTGGVNLDATSARHGLMSHADKAKLDRLVDTTAAADINADLADGDKLIVEDVSIASGSKFRSMTMSRLWTYVLAAIKLNVRLDDLVVASDSVLLDASANYHGLLPKLSGNSAQFLNGAGAWATPPGSTVFTGDTGSGGAQGQVPAPSAGDGSADKFLKADGTWAVPPLQTGSEHITIDGQTLVDALANGDELILYDVSESDFRKVTALALAQFAQLLPRYDTIYVPAGAMTPTETNGAAAESFSVAANSTVHDVLRFHSTKDTYADFSVAFPPDWDVDSPIQAKVLWTPYNTDGATDQWVRFTLGARAFGDGEDLGGAMPTTPVNIDDQLKAYGQVHMTGASGTVPVAGTAVAGKTVHFQLKRAYQFNNGGDGVALGTGACVLGIIIQYRRTADLTGW